MNKIIRILIYKVLSFINNSLPKQQNKYFIYDNTFRKDNLWIIKEYLEKQEGNIVIYYVDKNSVDKHDLKSNHKVKYVSNIFIGMWQQLTAKYVFYGYGTHRFTVKQSKKQIILNTWHGTPLKNIGYLKGDKPTIGYAQNFTYLISPSPFYDKVFKKAFGASDHQILKSGYPRNDSFYIKKDKNTSFFKNSKVKVALWLPTYRVSDENNFFDSKLSFPILRENNFEKLNSFLTEKKILIILKPHPFMKIPDFIKESKNFKIINNDFMTKNKLELNDLYKDSDCLITDYSSVYFDYLLLDKPIIFTIEDFNEYGDKRGFVVDDPLTIMPGVKVNSFDTFIKELSKIGKGVDLYIKEREKINKLANEYHRKENTHYILNYIQEQKG